MMRWNQLEEGARRIALERNRQIDGEGFANRRDDQYTDHALAWAAVAYAAPAQAFRRTRTVRGGRGYTDAWPAPWNRDWFKRKHVAGRPAHANEMDINERLRDLEKAGALIAAEIDRLLRIAERMTQRKPGTCIYCGCQENSPCDLGLDACAWADERHIVCTNPGCLAAAGLSKRSK